MGVNFRQHSKTQIKTSMPQQNQSTDFSNHLPPANTKFSFRWNSSPCHAPQNHLGKRSSLHCLPSGKRKAEKTNGLVEPATKLHIGEYMITKDKDDFLSAMQNISTKPTKGNVPEKEHPCREELPQSEKNWTVSLYQPHLRPTVQGGLLIPGLSLLPEPISQTVQLRPSSAQPFSASLVPWEPPNHLNWKFLGWGAGGRNLTATLLRWRCFNEGSCKSHQCIWTEKVKNLQAEFRHCDKLWFPNESNTADSE